MNDSTVNETKGITKIWVTELCVEADAEWAGGYLLSNINMKLLPNCIISLTQLVGELTDTSSCKWIPLYTEAGWNHIN